jgi:hypothetical protein
VRVRPRVLLVAALVLVLLGGVAVLGLVAVRQLEVAAGARCEVEVDGHTMTLGPERAEVAGVVAGVSVGRGLPARAASIALTVALAEHDLEALPGGSLGWANSIYDGLANVAGVRRLEVPAAAAMVGGRTAQDYADHEADARALASALTGHSPEALTCDNRVDAEEASDELRPSGLVPRAEALLADLETVFGDLSVGGFSPGGVSTGHMEGSAHYEGRAVDVFFRPVNEANRTRGWAVTHYLLTQADRLAVRTIIFDDRVWSSGLRADQGWRDYDPPSRSGAAEILEHRDHVHVDVVD